MRPRRYWGDLHAKVSPEMRERIEEMSLERGVSMGKIIRCMMERGLEVMKDG